MATKNLLPLILVVGLNSAYAQTQTLEPRFECWYERMTTLDNSKFSSTRETEKCVEEPGVEVPKFHIGDLVRGQHLLIHPVIKQDFYYKGAKCRWFSQADTARKDLVHYQGIACEIQPNAWKVIDKF